MSATIVIPPAIWPAGTLIELILIDERGDLYPAELTDNSLFVSGRGLVEVTDTGATFTIPCNDDIPAPPGQSNSFWRIEVRAGRHTAAYLVAFSHLNPPTNWNELIEAGTPVDPADIWSSRLWPVGGNTGQWGRKSAAGPIEWVDAPAGSGDVTGPASSTTDNLAVFADTSGKLIKDGGPPVIGIPEPPDDSNPKLRETSGGVSDWIASGDAAVKNTGSGAGTVCAGDDARLSDSRTPTAHTHLLTDVTDSGNSASRDVGLTGAHVAAGDAPANAVAAHEAAGDPHTQYHTDTRGDARYSALGHDHTLADVTDSGTAAARNVPAAGDAGAAECVLGNDSRLGTGGIPDAPSDGTGYRRKDAAWESDPLQSDAPSDGSEYVRKDATWAIATGGGGAVDSVTGQHSVTTSPTTGAVVANLVNDTASPGTNKVYGTDGAGARGWKDDPAGGAGGHVIEDEGTPLTARSALNFIGAGVTATDNAGADATDVTIPGGGGPNLTTVAVTMTVANQDIEEGNSYQITCSGITANRFLDVRAGTDGDTAQINLVSDADTATDVFVLQLRGHVGDGVTLDGLAPGTVRTEMFLRSDTIFLRWRSATDVEIVVDGLKQYGFFVHRTADFQLVPTTTITPLTDDAYNVEEYNEGGAFSLGIFTARRQGRYIFTASIRCDSAADNTRMSGYVQHNSANYEIGRSYSGSTGGGHFMGAAGALELILAVGDTVQAAVWTNDASHGTNEARISLMGFSGAYKDSI